MPFEKGNKISTGRPKGSPNKITSLVRESLSSYVQEILNTIDVNSFNVYPIPSSYNVTIETLLGSIENSFELYNISGMLVDKQNFNQSTDIDLSSLAKGTYVLKIHNSQGYINKKIIVE